MRTLLALLALGLGLACSIRAAAPFAKSSESPVAVKLTRKGRAINLAADTSGHVVHSDRPGRLAFVPLSVVRSRMSWPRVAARAAVTGPLQTRDLGVSGRSHAMHMSKKWAGRSVS